MVLLSEEDSSIRFTPFLSEVRKQGLFPFFFFTLYPYGRRCFVVIFKNGFEKTQKCSPREITFFDRLHRQYDKKDTVLTA